jgi:polyhydroxyalkanoate synthesis regulator phasin
MAKQFIGKSTSYTVDGAEARFIDNDEQTQALNTLRNEVPGLADARIEARIEAYKQEINAKFALKTALDGLLKAVDAAATYAPKSALEGFLKAADAAATYASKGELLAAKDALDKGLKDNADADSRRWSVISGNKTNVEQLQASMAAVETRVKALEDAPGGGGGGLKVGDTGWKDIETGQVGAGQYQYRVVGATMFLRKAGDEWRALPKPTKTVTHVATLPQTYGKLERASTLVVKKGDPAPGKQDEWTSDGSMIEIWPNWTVKYTCMDLQGIYAMDLLKTTVEKPLISPAGAGGGVTEEMLNQRLDTLKTSLEAQIKANSSELASVKTQANSTKSKIEALETKVTALENKPAGTGTPLLVLGPTEVVPAGTKPGTVIVRRSN